MVYLESDKSDRGVPPILTVLLSSSIALAIVTGLFYLIGRAWYEGSSSVLGLGLLAGWQSNEYIFAGAEILLTSSPFSLFLAASIICVIVFIVPEAKRRIGYLPRKWELPAFLCFIMLLTILLAFVLLQTQGAGFNLITKRSCPITEERSLSSPLLFALIVLAFTYFFSSFFFTRTLCLNVLTTGAIGALLCFYLFGWTLGANRLNGIFIVAQISTPYILDGSKQAVLMLGADDKNFVVLLSRGDQSEHPQPIYVSRAEVKGVRLIGSSSINNFFCRR